MRRPHSPQSPLLHQISKGAGGSVEPYPTHLKAKMGSNDMPALFVTEGPASTADTLTASGVSYTLDLRTKHLCANFALSGDAPAPSVDVCLRREHADQLDLVLFADRSSHELLVEAGVTSLTHRIYPTQEKPTQQIINCTERLCSIAVTCTLSTAVFPV